MLSKEQVEAYHRDGYITVENVYSAAELDELRRVTDSFVEKSREVTEHTDVFDLEPSHQPDAPKVRRIKNPISQHQAYRTALEQGGMLDIVAQLIGPHIRLQNTKLNLKSGGFGSAVEWHQDLAFYPHTNEDVLAVGLCLDDMTVENGALMAIPGAHKSHPMWDHHQNGHFVGAITDSAFSDDEAQTMTVRAGGITIHHGRMPHGSRPNHSNRQRRLLLFELRAVDAWPILGIPDWETFNSLILRGEPTWAPRIETCPVRIPLPPTPTVGSIYEVQTHLKDRPLAAQ